MRSVAKTVAGMRGRAGRRGPSQQEGYLTCSQAREMNAHLRAEHERKRGITRAPFSRFQFRNPVAKPTTIMPASAPAPAPVAPPVPSLADIVAHLEKEQANARVEACEQAFHFTRLFSHNRQDDAEKYRVKTMELIGVMDAAETMIRYMGRPQPQ